MKFFGATFFTKKVAKPPLSPRIYNYCNKGSYKLPFKIKDKKEEFCYEKKKFVNYSDDTYLGNCS